MNDVEVDELLLETPRQWAEKAAQWEEYRWNWEHGQRCTGWRDPGIARCGECPGCRAFDAPAIDIGRLWDLERLGTADDRY